jgi:hypothetical protein
MIKLRLIAFSCVLISSHAFAGHDHAPPTMPKEFATLKKLVGKWEGTTVMEGKEEKAVVEYKLTSAGTALVETMGPGTPHEMVSVYHKQGKSLGMTHYCALGNQPHMALKKATDKSVAFEMTKPVGISSMKEMHMHAVTLTLADDDTLKHEWTNYTNGKNAGTMVFNFKRK